MVHNTDINNLLDNKNIIKLNDMCRPVPKRRSSDITVYRRYSVVYKKEGIPFSKLDKEDRAKVGTSIPVYQNAPYVDDVAYLLENLTMPKIMKA